MSRSAEDDRRAATLYIHIPTPGDHYSAATGSATMTVIYEISREHARAGGQTRVIVGRGTRHDYPVGVCAEVEFIGLPTKRQKAIDAALGMLGYTRRFATAAYEPALSAIERSFEGPVILHNSPAPLRAFRDARPRSRLGLYAHNALFRTYSTRELHKTLDAADFVVCVSAFLADGISQRLGSRSRVLAVVHNGVDLERFHPTGNAAGATEPTVLFLGRVIPEKGPDILLHAARTLIGAKRRFRVRIVGSKGFSPNEPLSSYERRLRQIAEPIRDAVEFKPFVDRARIIDEYARASVFCVPSNWDDPCPLTLLEALACGLPTIASSRGGIPEIGGNALLYFRPPSVSEFADRLAYLIDDESARAEWGRRARDRVRGLGWDEQYRKLRQVVEA